jgi:hypothetical protein
MKPLTQEWVDKAEGDFSTAGRELRARKDPNMIQFVFMPNSLALEKYYIEKSHTSLHLPPKSPMLGDFEQQNLGLDHLSNLLKNLA